MQRIKEIWSESKLYRVLLTLAVIYAVLRLIVQGGYLAMLLLPELGIMGGVPEWVGAEGSMIPADLQIYLDAAEHFSNKQNLYLQGSLERLEDHYPYGPSFAMLFVPFTWLSPASAAIFHTLLHIVAYGLMYIQWHYIFQDFHLERADKMLAWTLPVWLLFSAFWADLGYLNIYLIMAWLGTMFIEAVLKERFLKALLWVSIIVQIKPHWTFALAVPLLLGRYRFFFRLLSWAIIVYIAVVGITLLIAGPAYGWQQYGDYVEFLARLSRDFPWRGPERDFLGYNHSIKQIVFYLLGVSKQTLRLATGIKIVLLLPLAIVGIRYLIHPIGYAGSDIPKIGLDLAFALYLGAFIWLDMVWEISLGIALFPYLLGTSTRRTVKIWLSALFLPYTLLDLWQVLSFTFGGMDVILPGPYIITDPSIYFPMIMLVILTFYMMLIIRLNYTIQRFV
jgi:hypothetical protein